MTPRRLALLLAPALPLAPLMLALSACGDAQDEGSKREGPSAPLGFELAFAATAGDEAAAPAAAPATSVARPGETD